MCVYTAFVIDVFSRRIVGWRTNDHLRTDLVLDALDQAAYDRLDGPVADGLTAHSDAGTRYTAMLYTDRLAEAGIAPSIGSVGDSFDNAMAESIMGLYKAEVIPAANAGTPSSRPGGRPCGGSHGSTTTGSTKHSAISHPPSSRSTTTVKPLRPSWSESRNEHSGIPGRVQEPRKHTETCRTQPLPSQTRLSK